MHQGGHGVCVAADPRSAFTLAAGVDGVSASRIFFLEGGETDDGYHNGDVVTDYQLSLALLAPDEPPEHSSDEHEFQDQAGPVEWGQLYQSYISLHPWLQQGPAGPGGLMAASWLGLPVR